MNRSEQQPVKEWGTEIKSLCGAVNLLGTIFNKDTDRLKIRYGLLEQCSQCDQPAQLGKLYCSKDCKNASTHIKISCSQCGKIFVRSQSQLERNTSQGKQRFWFCSRYCRSQFVGQNYGFRVHPENCGSSFGSHRKWNWSIVYEARDRTGFGAWRLSRLLGIPLSTISVILRKRNC